ncbi:MAG: hypothetical protein IKZ87_07005 [Actinomycetaceae bacterium]|nr:hypothetical protein [Actinomycetaceae bacterium]
MNSTSNAPTRFASDLKMAIAISGKSFDDIANELLAHKIRTTPKALRAWTYGEIAPRPKTSEPAITALEKILNLAPGTLLSSFVHDLKGNTADLDHSVASSRYSSQLIFESFRDIDERTNWNNEVYREELNENIVISPDFRKIRQSVRAGVRVPYHKNGTLHVSTFWDLNSPPPLDDIGIYEIEGALVGETTMEETGDGIAKTTALILPDGAQPGDLHYISYEHRFTCLDIQKATAQRAFSWHLNSYSCTVTFLGRIPENIEWVVTSVDENSFGAQKEIYTRPLTPMGNSVTVSVTNINDAVGLIRWD